MFKGLRARVARMFGRQPIQITKMYASARSSHSASPWRSGSSADTELHTSLRALRSRSRMLVRDAAHAKRAKVIVVNNVVGPGMGLQAQVKNTRGELRKPLNTQIEATWKEWARADSCHTGGALCFQDLERLCMGQVFEAGEIFIRLHFSRFGGSAVPLALEIIEAERIADSVTFSAPRNAGANVRMGVERDGFGRALGYYVRDVHPNELRFSALRSESVSYVPAAQMIHLKITDRWPQTRGEPWLHAVARKLDDLDGYTEAEIVAARGAASYMGVIEKADPAGGVLDPVTQDDGTRQQELDPGTILTTEAGDKFNFVAPNRPNSSADPFLRFLLREVAAGVGPSYESLSRDYSQSNYSSSRLAQLDDRDLWRMLQGWWKRSFREELHKTWLAQAVLGRAVPLLGVEEYAQDPIRYSAATFKARGWSWIDPTKEVKAAKEAVLGGFTTVGDVIAQTGGGKDLNDVIDERKQELEAIEAAGLEFDTNPGAQKAAPAPGGDDEPAPGDDDEPAPGDDDEAKRNVIYFGKGAV